MYDIIKPKKNVRRHNYNILTFIFGSTGQAHHGQVPYISPPIHLDSELERPPVRGELYSFFFSLNKKKFIHSLLKTIN